MPLCFLYGSIGFTSGVLCSFKFLTLGSILKTTPMKKNLPVFLFLFFAVSFKAQYRKMPLSPNYYWQQHTTINSLPPYINCSYALKVTKDSILNGKTFKFIETYNASYLYFSESALLRQDTVLKRVTAILFNQENILYNFNKSVGDTALLLGAAWTPQTFTLQAKDSVLLNDGFYHKRFTYNNMPPVIEGVGSISGLLWPMDSFESFTTLNCLGRISPTLSIYSSAGLSSACPLTTGIASNSPNKNAFGLFPNPSSDVLHINFDTALPKTLIIKNMLGQTMLTVDPPKQTTMNLNISSLEAGFYFVELGYEAGAMSRSFIKN